MTTESCEVPEPSRRFVRYFTKYSRWYLKRHFHGVRILPSAVGRISASAEIPSASGIVCMNHPSWWDPLVGVVLASRFFAEHTHYVPMDAKMLGHYGFFRRLGFYGVTPGAAGVRDFLSQSLELLRRPASMIWITPQGRFADVRERPMSVKRGIGHIMSQAEACFVLPVAVEYAFWNHRLPEILVNVGDVHWLPDDKLAAVSECSDFVAESLQTAQDELAESVKRRRETDFVSLLEGQTGTGGIYGWWERIRTKIRPQRNRDDEQSDAGSHA